MREKGETLSRWTDDRGKQTSAGDGERDGCVCGGGGGY